MPFLHSAKWAADFQVANSPESEHEKAGMEEIPCRLRSNYFIL
jgi:hypothetical protein